MQTVIMWLLHSFGRQFVITNCKLPRPCSLHGGSQQCQDLSQRPLLQKHAFGILSWQPQSCDIDTRSARLLQEMQEEKMITSKTAQGRCMQLAILWSRRPEVAQGLALRPPQGSKCCEAEMAAICNHIPRKVYAGWHMAVIWDIWQRVVLQ